MIYMNLCDHCYLSFCEDRDNESYLSDPYEGLRTSCLSGPNGDCYLSATRDMDFYPRSCVTDDINSSFPGPLISWET